MIEAVQPMGRDTNKTRRQAQADSARAKAATARVAQQRADQRRRALIIISSVVAVALIGAIIAIAAVNSGGSSKKTPETKTAASASLINQVASVPEAPLASVGKGGAAGGLKAINDPPLTNAGKPEVLFIGGEFCPYCAGERWALVQALSRFGTFSGLSQIHSS